MAYTFQPTASGTVDVFQDGKKITTTSLDNAKTSFGYTGSALSDLSGTQPNPTLPQNQSQQNPTLPENTSNQSPLLSFADSLNKAVNLARQNRNKSSLDIMKPFQGTVAASDFGAILGNLNSASDTFSSDLLKNANKANTNTFDTISGADGAVYQIEKDASGKIIGSPSLVVAGKSTGGGTDIGTAISWLNLIQSGAAKITDIPDDATKNAVAQLLNTTPTINKASQDAIGQANTVIGKIDEVIPAISYATTGVGAYAAGIKGTPQYDLATQLDTIKANIGFSALQAMRAASPTGGALGQVSERENALLQATLSSIDQGQSPEQLKANLALVKLHFNNLKKILAAPPNAQYSYDKNGGIVFNASGSSQSQSDEVQIQLPDGSVGTIPRENLEEALKRGAKQI